MMLVKIIKSIKKYCIKCKGIYKNLGDQFWRARRRYIKYYESLPLDDFSILLEASHGSNINGNIFYIAKYLASSDRYKMFSIYFCARGRFASKYRAFFEAYGLNNITVVVLASDEYFKLLASSKYLINDTSFGQYYIKKKGQVYFNTWHGTPLKALGRQVPSEAHKISNVQKNLASADFLLFPNEHTRDTIIQDYMLENISHGSYFMAGYPRNEVFFSEERGQQIREAYNLGEKKIYGYMPTFRGATDRGGTAKNSHYLNYYLYEIDAQLHDDEIFFVNLHPLAQKDVNFKEFKHIRCFPNSLETYDFLTATDVLVTDYSSVFFDYAISRKKIILFVYDKQEYLASRGMYISMDTLPFPQVSTPEDLLCELRSKKRYDDTAFLNNFCRYEDPSVSKKLCDHVILGKPTDLEVNKIPNNGKKNVLLYAGDLSNNGITTSLRNLFNCIDLDKRNYYFAFYTERVKSNAQNIFTFPQKISYWGMTGVPNLTIIDLFVRKMHRLKVIPTALYMKLQGDRIKQELCRLFGTAEFNSLIQFNGYEQDIITIFSVFSGTKTIFVHNNMIEEIRVRQNQRPDVLRFAYQHYDNVAVVTDDIIEPTVQISKKRSNIHIVPNTIDFESVRKKAENEIEFDSYTETTITLENLKEILDSDETEIFINIARFAPEKGQARLIAAFEKYRNDHPNAYLVVIGGNSWKDYYKRISTIVKEKGLGNCVFLIKKLSNPYAILKKCDYFVLSSFYEGLGLVLLEADILGVPVISTNIAGPRGFMTQHGGTLVENTEDGIYRGMCLLHNGAVKPMNIDWVQYNKDAVAAFEGLMN